MSTLFEQVTQRRQEHQAAFQKLARDYASGAKLTPAVADAILREADKTPDDLEQRKEWHLEREHNRSVMAEGARLQATRPAIEKQLTKAKAVLDAAEAKYNETIRPLRFERDAINTAASAASSAEAELHRTAPDDFDDQQAELEHELNQCRIESDAASKHLREMVSRLSHERNPQDGSAVDAAEVARLSESVQTAQARVDAASELSTSLVAQQESLVAEMKAA